MAWSRVRLFNPYGIMLDEIDVATTRSWALDGIGRCQFSVPIYDNASGGGFNPKLTLANFQWGNFILIEHKPSVNADGTQNGLLPPWVGIILPPRIWSYGKVNITAYSAEQALAYRPMPNDGIRGVPGGIYGVILDIANKWGGIQFQRGAIDLSGNANLIDIRTTALDHIQQYSKQVGYDWDISPLLGNNNQLTLQGNWYKKKGIETGLVLSNHNLELSDPLLSEQGTFYNTVNGSNDATTSAIRIEATAQNAVSVGESGPLVIKTVFSNTQGMAQDVIQSMTDAFLANLANNPTFVRTFAPTVLDVDNVFSFCATGNIFSIQNDTVGFSNGGIGFNGTARVTAVEYSDLSNTCKLAVTLQ